MKHRGFNGEQEERAGELEKAASKLLAADRARQRRINRPKKRPPASDSKPSRLTLADLKYHPLARKAGGINK
jgi:hypothetical protein